MGIKDVFSQSHANLLGMFPHYLYISRVIQQAQIEVNENGTVAAAAAGKFLNVFFHSEMKYYLIL